MAIEALSNIVRAGVGAFTTGGATAAETNPVFVYTAGILTQVNYASGNFKQLTYTAGLLTRLDYVVGAVTIRKTFNYVAGVLTGITQTTV